MAFNPLAGKDATVTIGSLTYNFKVAKVAMKSKLGDVTGFDSEGFRQFISGPVDAKLTLSGAYDGGNMSFVIGAAATVVVAYSMSIDISLPVIIESIDINADVENPDDVQIVCQSTGTFTAAIE